MRSFSPNAKPIDALSQALCLPQGIRSCELGALSRQKVSCLPVCRFLLAHVVVLCARSPCTIWRVLRSSNQSPLRRGIVRTRYHTRMQFALDPRNAPQTFVKRGVFTASISLDRSRSCPAIFSHLDSATYVSPLVFSSFGSVTITRVRLVDSQLKHSHRVAPKRPGRNWHESSEAVKLGSQKNLVLDPDPGEPSRSPPRSASNLTNTTAGDVFTRF